MKRLIFILSLSFCVIASANSVTYTPDGFGGYRGSNGINYSPDGYGGFRGTNGSNCKQDYYGVISCSDGNQNGNIGWGAVTNAMGGIGSSIGNSQSNSSSVTRVKEIMDYLDRAKEANSFKPPVQFSGKWKKITSSKDGSTTFYIDKETIMRGNDSVFYWQLNDNSKPDPFGDRSATTYNQADCNLMAYKQLTLTTYEQQMARQLTKVIDYLPDKEWTYAKSGYINYAILEEACGKNKIQVEQEINLNCESEELDLFLSIYPATKEFGLYKGRKQYVENGNFIDFIDFLDHPEKGKEFFKMKYSLNRLTGELSELTYAKSGVFSMLVDGMLYMPYESEPIRNSQFICKNNASLF